MHRLAVFPGATRSGVERTLALFGLACLALLAGVPFLLPFHTTPIPSFHAEWLAAALGLAASLALVGTRLPLPGAAALALAIAAIALGQQFVGRAAVPQLSSLFALYLVWAALLSCTGARLAGVFGQTRLVAMLATAVLAGSLLAATLGMAQPWLAPLGWPGYALAAGGPLGQANHLSVYLWLGLASALYLRTTARLSAGGFWSAATVLTLAAVLVGQRSSFLYALALIAVATWQRRQFSDRRSPAPRRLALGVGLSFVLLQPLAMLLPTPGFGAASPPALRAMQQVEGASVRLQLLRLGAHGVAAAPLTGNGIGSYPGLALAHADDIAPADNPGPAEHAHNLLVDLGVELGLPAALLVLLAALYWLRRLPQGAAGAEAVWAAAVVGILGLHSMIEYPLWHTYFLGLVAVVAGAFGAERGFGTKLTGTALVLGLAAWGSLTLAGLQRDYARLETALALGNNMPAASALLLGVPQSSLLVPWVQTTACVSLDPLGVPVADGLAVCHAAVAFAPGPSVGTNAAVLLWRTGKIAEARDLLRRMACAYQYNPTSLDALLVPLVRREAMLAELWTPETKKAGCFAPPSSPS